MKLRPASKKRRALSVYLDWCVFAAPWGILQWIVGKVMGRPWDHLVTQVATFFVIEWIWQRLEIRSPGEWLLRIERDGRGNGYVRTEQLEDENVLGMLLGTFGFLGGSKTMTGWIVGLPRLTPFFAFDLHPSLEAAAYIVVGLFCWLMGAALLRLHHTALPLGLLYAFGYAVPVVAYQERLPEVLKQMVVAKRAYQERPPPDPEVLAQVSGASAKVVVVAVFAFAVAVLATVLWTKLSRSHRVSPPLPRTRPRTR